MTIRVFRHGAIHTGSPKRPVVEALAVDGETIVAVGSESEVRAEVGGAADLVDLDGAAVLPGLYDAHIHTANLAHDLVDVDLRGARTVDEATGVVARHAAHLPPGAWLFGGRWDSNKWRRPVQPTRHDLDVVCPDRPVALPSIDGHTVWTNSRALQLVGITRDTPDPSGGQIVRDEHGDPTGILRESASYPLRAVMNSPEAGDLLPLLLAAQEHLLSVGLTSVHDIDGEDCHAAYRRMRSDGKLKLRVHKAIPVTHLDEAIAEGRRTGEGDDWLRTGPVKIYGDGALGSHTCHMNHPFVGDEGNQGIAVTDFEDIVVLVRKANSAGIAVATHAIGDRANQLVLDAYETTRREGLSAQRNRIEHVQHLRPGDVVRMAQLGIIASMQPTHCTSDIDLADALLAGRDLASYAWRSMLNAGVALAFGSDAPVESPNPFPSLYAAMTRCRADGTPLGGWQPEQRLSAAEALTAHTLGSAYAAGEERRKGVLTPGMLADFIAVDADPFTDSADVVRQTTVLTTIVGGEIRWQRQRLL